VSLDSQYPLTGSLRSPTSPMGEVKRSLRAHEDQLDHLLGGLLFDIPFYAMTIKRHKLYVQ